MAIFDPSQNPHPLTDHQKIWYRWLCRRPLRLCRIWCKSVHGGLWANGWNITKNLFSLFIYTLFFMNSPTGQTRRIFTLDGWNDADLRKNVPFGGLVNIASHFGGEIPQKPQFLGVNRRFQAKRAKYWKFHVIETNASISTKFCTTIETIKNSSWVVPIGPQHIQDGGRPPFWKTVKSLYLCNRLTDLIRFGTMTHIGLLERICR